MELTCHQKKINAIESLLCTKFIECGETSKRNRELKSDYEESYAESNEGG